MPKLIIDEFSGLQVSRQRVWQLRRERDGFCRKCGVVPRQAESAYCPRCQAWVKARNKRRAARPQYAGI